MKFFYELRTRILKRGETGVGSYTHIKKLEFPLDMKKFGTKPANAQSLFFGDTLGGSGWEVGVSPGVMEKFYVDLPSDIGTAGLYFKEAPMGSEPHNASDADVISLSTKYIERLQVILDEAKSRFRSS